MNLDDEEDKRNSIKFSNIGMTSLNPFMNLLGIGTSYRTDSIYLKNTNVYVGTWIVPGVQQGETD